MPLSHSMLQMMAGYAASAPRSLRPRFMIRGRLRAACHITGQRWRPGHRIWRLYRLRGWQTLAIVCECGKVFR